MPSPPAPEARAASGASAALRRLADSALARGGHGAEIGRSRAAGSVSGWHRNGRTAPDAGRHSRRRSWRCAARAGRPSQGRPAPTGCGLRSRRRCRRSARPGKAGTTGPSRRRYRRSRRSRLAPAPRCARQTVRPCVGSTAQRSRSRRSGIAGGDGSAGARVAAVRSLRLQGPPPHPRRGSEASQHGLPADQCGAGGGQVRRVAASGGAAAFSDAAITGRRRRQAPEVAGGRLVLRGDQRETGERDRRKARASGGASDRHARSSAH